MSVPAEQFKLHFEYKIMVCPTCFSGKTKILQDANKLKVKNEVIQPPGWDKEDEYLEKISKLKKEQDQAQFKRIPGTNQVSCKCMKCKYVFKYDHFKKIPVSCPYCNQDIPRFKTFNLLKFYK